MYAVQNATPTTPILISTSRKRLKMDETVTATPTKSITQQLLEEAKSPDHQSAVPKIVAVRSLGKISLTLLIRGVFCHIFSDDIARKFGK